MVGTRRWPAPGSAWARASRSRRRFVLGLLLLAVVGICVSVTLLIKTGHAGWWSVVAPVSALTGSTTMLLTPAVGEQSGRRP